jgi:hypothetical protein
VITVVAFGHLPGYDRADMLAIAVAVAAAITTR